jgi:hypothetical protein
MPSLAPDGRRSLTSRAIERLRNELVETLFERDCTTVQRHILGELLVTLGKQLPEVDKEDTS